MSRHQLFKRKTKVEEKVFGPFLKASVCRLASSCLGLRNEFFYAREIYVGENLHIIQSFKNQQNTDHHAWLQGFLHIGIVNIFSGINKYVFTSGEWPVSKDYSLFLSPSHLLTVRGLEFSLFHTFRK